MTREEIAAIRDAFSDSLEPVTRELKAIHAALDEHGKLLNDHSKLLNDHSKLLQSIDNRLTNVEGNLDGVEILVRRHAG